MQHECSTMADGQQTCNRTQTGTNISTMISLQEYNKCNEQNGTCHPQTREHIRFTRHIHPQSVITWVRSVMQQSPRHFPDTKHQQNAVHTHFSCRFGLWTNTLHKMHEVVTKHKCPRRGGPCSPYKYPPRGGQFLQLLQFLHALHFHRVMIIIKCSPWSTHHYS